MSDDVTWTAPYPLEPGEVLPGVPAELIRLSEPEGPGWQPPCPSPDDPRLCPRYRCFRTGKCRLVTTGQIEAP